MPSIRATASCPSGRRSRACARRKASSSSAPRPSRSKRSATSCARAPKRRRRTCRLCRAAPWSPRSTTAVALAREIGAPLLVKAVGGGGGRGMKRVDVSRICRRPGAGLGRGRCGVRRRARLSGALRRQRAARRGAGAGRRHRARHPSGRARLLGAAPLSEADRGNARARTVDRAARRAACGGGAIRASACRIAAPARSSSWSIASATPSISWR